jgi:hypothetical protein
VFHPRSAVEKANQIELHTAKGAGHFVLRYSEKTIIVSSYIYMQLLCVGRDIACFRPWRTNITCICTHGAHITLLGGSVLHILTSALGESEVEQQNQVSQTGGLF